MTRHVHDVFADYYQFYLQDDDVAYGDLSDAWTEEAVERLLATAPHVVGVGTVRNMSVPVSVEILDASPEDDAPAWDQVVECSLEVDTGRVVLAGCGETFRDAVRIAVKPGRYAVRVSYGGLDRLSDDGLEGADRYRLQLWPSETDLEPTVRKQRPTGQHP